MTTNKPSNFFFIGNFGFTSSQLDGQTVKTRSIYDLFSMYLNCSLPYFDTDQLKTSKASLIAILPHLFRLDYLVYLPAYKNLKYFFPILFTLSKVFKFKIILFTVGGWFETFLIKHPSIALKLRNIDAIYFQTDELVQLMEKKYNFNNVEWIPNFRISETFHRSFPKPDNQKRTFKIVFMSRINRKKGIDTIFEMLKVLHDHHMDKKIIVDFYGPIYEPDRLYFENQLSIFGNAKYQGILEPSVIHTTLQNYNVLVLPTKYYTEGFPGAILDAYISGIPVIATRWRYAEEFINDGETGYIIPFENSLTYLVDKIILLSTNESLNAEMKKKSLLFAEKFHHSNAWNIIRTKFDT